jgi:rubrerythrin
LKKKANPILTPAVRVVDPELLEAARKTVFQPKPPRTFACRVCGSGGATEQSDSLCWVCRRLKISAWREIEQQMPLSE